MRDDDVLIMPDPVYYGGTTDRSVTSERHRARRARARPRKRWRSPSARACGDKLIELAEPGDRIVVMGARDDTLSVFAAELVERLRR